MSEMRLHDPVRNRIYLNASRQQKVVFWAVPVPPELLDTLSTTHGIREVQKSHQKALAHARNHTERLVDQLFELHTRMIKKGAA